MNDIIQNNIKKIMDINGVSISELSKRSGIDMGVISRLVKREDLSNTKLKVLDSVADALGVKLEDLYDESSFLNKRNKVSFKIYKNKIKDIMEEKNISINELSEICPVIYPTLHRAINRDELNTTALETLSLIADALGVQITDLYEEIIQD